ncbi:MAG: FAD-dependent oxidoreductase, partial [Treponemataceae bacterium]|nr:FAD-dependent oxidoreductase [Treponemataceae bacterium]
KVGVPGEDAEGVWTGVDFLHACGEEKKPVLKGNTVVIGGGNVAIDAARCVVRCGSKETYMISLETRDIMPASPHEIEIAESEDIKLNGGWGPKEILTEGGKVKGIVFKKCLSVFDMVDGKKKFAPKYDENDTMTIECSNVVLTVGQASIWGDLVKDEKVEFKGPAIQADRLTYQCVGAPDIFVGGDVYTGPKFAIDAIAAGKEGAISIHRFVQPHSSLTIGRNRREFIELNKDDILVENYDNSKRQMPGKKGLDKMSFECDAVTFTEEQVKKETGRCLSCGASIVDTNKCVGCGVCTTKCAFDAIHLYRENPGCSVMRKSEDKLKYILPNMLKQKIKFTFVKK